jgi:hypothetical protein
VVDFTVAVLVIVEVGDVVSTEVFTEELIRMMVDVDTTDVLVVRDVLVKLKVDV